MPLLVSKDNHKHIHNMVMHSSFTYTTPHSVASDWPCTTYNPYMTSDWPCTTYNPYMTSDWPCTTYNPYMTASLFAMRAQTMLWALPFYEMWKRVSSSSSSSSRQPMLMCHELCMNESACHLLHSETNSNNNIIMQIICKMNTLCIMQI